MPERGTRTLETNGRAVTRSGRRIEPPQTRRRSVAWFASAEGDLMGRLAIVLLAFALARSRTPSADEVSARLERLERRSVQESPDALAEWRRDSRAATGVLSGVFFGVGATFVASALVLEGDVSFHGYLGVAFGAFGFAMFGWALFAPGRRSPQVVTALACFVAMALAIANAVQESNS